MDSKRKAGDDLKLFCKEYDVPGKIKCYGSKEQAYKWTKFMKEVHSKFIDYNTSKPEPHNQSPVEGVIRKVSQK